MFRRVARYKSREELDSRNDFMFTTTDRNPPATRWRRDMKTSEECLGSLKFSPVLDDHHVLLPTVSGTADVPHPAGLTGIVTIDKVLQRSLCVVDLQHTHQGLGERQVTSCTSVLTSCTTTDVLKETWTITSQLLDLKMTLSLILTVSTEIYPQKYSLFHLIFQQLDL